MLALHAPDGFLEPGTAIVTAALATAVFVWAIRQSGRELGERQLPLAGVSAAFIFAAQMLSFPVAAGTTGHLMGAALAAILLGPATGTVVVTVVLLVQSLLFADGGLTALGYNTINMAIVPAFGGYALFRLLRRMLPANSGGVVGATGLAAGASVVLGAMAFAIEWLFGASAPVAFDDVFTAVVGVHLLIGIGEGVISAIMVGAVLASRPDLVAGAADLDPSELGRRGPVAGRTFALAGILIAAVVAVVISQFAATGPDGLERAAIDAGFDDQAGQHLLDGTLFADYATDGVDDETLSLAIAGGTGTAVTLAVGYGLVLGARSGAGGRSADRRRPVRV